MRTQLLQSLQQAIIRWGLPNVGQVGRWRRKGFSMPAPNEVKWGVLRRWGSADSPWVESGTYLGATTRELAAWSPLVVSLEPDLRLFRKAEQRFRKFKNVQIINVPSETG